jgi:magnesium transporter
MKVAPPRRPPRSIPIVLSSTALVSFMSVWKAAGLATAQLGAAVWFVAGVTTMTVGAPAPWLVLGAVVIGMFMRAVDVESWALFVPSGLVGRVERAYGPRAARLAAAAILSERLLFTALACVVAAHYGGFVLATGVASRATSVIGIKELLTVIAAGLVGLLWIRARLGLTFSPATVARGIWIAVGTLAVTAVWSTVTVLRSGLLSFAAVSGPVTKFTLTGWPRVDAVLTWISGFALALTALGGGESLARTAQEFAPPRIQGLRRTAIIVALFSLAVTAVLAFAFTLVVPSTEAPQWLEVPIAGVATHLAGPGWLRHLMEGLLAAAALLMLVPAAHAAMEEAEQAIRRLAEDRALPAALAVPHARFGTLANAVDVIAAATIMILIVSSGRIVWLGRAYTVAILATMLLKLAAVSRLRRVRAGPSPFMAPCNLRFGSRQWPLGIIVTATIIAIAGASMLVIFDPPAIAAAGLIGTLVLLFSVSSRHVEPRPAADELDSFELLPSADLLRQADARPGNLLVPVRHPHSLAHVSAALQAAGDRDVVVMTVRLLGVDADEDAPDDMSTTVAERELFSRVVALTERHRRSVRLLVVPGRNVFDAIASTIVRLRSAEVYVGESATLSAGDQARLLGDAWERAEKPPDLPVRLVITHHGGRTDAYHLGAHPPSLTSADLDLIHRVWLDAVKSVGPSVHHHDIVRAALTQMEQQLSGSQRDEALAAIRHAARPADEFAALVRSRDFPRLRDMARNRDAGELAALLTDLPVEDQVVVFRVLPRREAASVFEYLSLDAQAMLLRAMGQEDVAALLNNMAPDDRTMFLEELPAAATRQLLALLSPAERSVALSLLGYPEDSIGRLMTPNYVAVREHWTVREVLDYIRAHGQDSETLNVIYVVDEQGTLIDDIRIREFLLTSPDNRVSDLMDRRFVALRATDNQETAVAAFRQHDRVALPVTDTAGMLIGIVTIDDVLDVVEATATEDIQRIGGTEALDEPYMRISFWRMIQKRAGWLTALFLGEMLTATAMGVFEAEIAKAVVLALFVPLIISSGGNSGSQASTLVIRALALGEVTLRDWWAIMRREIMAGLALGGILGSIGFLRITLWSAFSPIYGEHWLLVAITVAVALIGIVLWGTLIGSLLPLLLRRLGFDPATSSAPFVATLVDVTGLVIYFTVALVILRGTLL